MVKYCSVRTCPSRLNREKVTLFSVPKNDEDRKVWSDRLATQLTTTSKVCERHFEPDDVPSERTFTDPCGKIHSEPLLKRVLRQGALPIDIKTDDQIHRKRVLEVMGLQKQTPFDYSKLSTISEHQNVDEVTKENSSYLLNSNKQISQKNSKQSSEKEYQKFEVTSTEKQCDHGIEDNRNLPLDLNEHTFNQSFAPHAQNITQASSADNVALTIADKSKNNDSTVPNDTTDGLYLKLLSENDDLQYPSGWTFTHCLDKKVLLFSLLDALPSPTLGSNNVVPVFKKQIIVNENNYTQIRMYDKNVDMGEFQLTSVADFQGLMNKVDEAGLCVGGPLVREYAKVHPEHAYKDRAKWRHNNCPLMLSKDGICKDCLSLHKSLSQIMQRLNQPRLKKRIRMSKRALSPDSLEKITAVRKRRKYTQARLTRREKQLALAKRELADVHEALQKVKETHFEEELTKLKNIPENQVVLIKECFAAGKLRNPKARRYSDEWILLCLLIHIRSPATYAMLQRNNILPLPAKSTILKYLKSSNVDCGFDDNFFKLFGEELKLHPEMARNGILSFDEISVRTSLEVNTKTMTFSGLTNYGKDSDLNAESLNEQADHGLVFMFSSLAANFHQPVAMFASKGTTKSNILASLVLLAIINIEKVGGKVQGIVCDGATTNRSMWTELGISGSLNNCNNWFENPFDEKRRVYAFSDAPHLIKCIRNRLEARKVLKVNNGEVEWRFYENLYRQESQSILKVCPKLTERHVHIPDSMKMRVSLATQLFSNSVADGLTYYSQEEQKEVDKETKEFEGCEATIKFTLQINNMFDAMNRSYKSEGIRNNSPDFEVLEEAIKWLDEWERTAESKDDFLTKSTAEGLRVTLHSTLDLTHYLLDHCGFDYVLTSKMNQDCLEQFFGCIRQAGCQNDHPTMHTFQQLYHLLSIYKIIKPPKYGNCTVREDETIKKKITLADLKTIFPDTRVNYKRDRLKKLQEELASRIDEEEWDWDNLIETECKIGAVDECIIYYLSGYVARKMFTWVKCEECRKAFVSSFENLIHGCPQADLVNLKSKGGLIHPNIHLFHLYKEIESLFQLHLHNARVYSLVTEDLFNSNYKFTFPCSVHKADMLSRCIDYYLTMRMHQYCKQKNRDSLKKSQDIKKKSRHYNT